MCVTDRFIHKILRSPTAGRLSQLPTRFILSSSTRKRRAAFPAWPCRAGVNRGSARSRAAVVLPRAGRPVSMAWVGAAQPRSLRSSRRKARSFSYDLPSGRRGSRYGAGIASCHKGPRRCRCFAFGRGGIAAGGRLRIGRSFAGRGSRSKGVNCYGSGAGRDVKVRSGAPSAGTPRRFFVQEPCGSEGVGSAPFSGVRMRWMATSARTRRLLLYHGGVTGLNQILRALALIAAISSGSVALSPG